MHALVSGQVEAWSGDGFFLCRIARGLFVLVVLPGVREGPILERVSALMPLAGLLLSRQR